MKKPIDEAVTLATGAALETMESMDRIIALKARVDDLDAFVEVNFKKISDIVSDLANFKEQTTKQIQQLIQSAAAFQTWQSNTVQPVLTAVNDPTKGLVATNAQTNQTAGALVVTQTTVTTISDRLAKVEAKVFHQREQQQQQQPSFNLTIPFFDEESVKVVMIDPTTGNTIMTFKTTPGSTVSVEGTPGQVSTFQLLNSYNVVLDSVTLTIPGAATAGSSTQSAPSAGATTPAGATSSTATPATGTASSTAAVTTGGAVSSGAPSTAKP